MKSFEEMGLTLWDGVIIGVVGLAVFFFTKFIYPPLITWLKKKNYVGYDIHKHNRPATAESGGLGLAIGIIIGLIAVGILYPILWPETLIFIITVLIAAIVGWIDDRRQLSSLKKILLMFVTGIPIFLANLYFIKFVEVQSPILPILGRLQITIIYPLVLPFIIMILTNTVNMLEGYNGEGSGTTSIATVFMVIAAVMMGSSEGLLFGVPIAAALLAFYYFNKFPAKIFPGDIGTLVMGASIGLLGIFGSLEMVMMLVMLPQIFNSFYYIASVRGFTESHDLTKKDIFILKDENSSIDYIYASDEHKAPLTLPRLIVATGKLSEKSLVKNFMMLSIVSGLFAIITTQWILPNAHVNVVLSSIIVCVSVLGIIWMLKKYRQIRGIAYIMILVLCIGMGLLGFIKMFVIESVVNWLLGGFLGVLTLAAWYFITVWYFWYEIKVMKQKKGFISAEAMNLSAESSDDNS